MTPVTHDAVRPWSCPPAWEAPRLAPGRLRGFCEVVRPGGRYRNRWAEILRRMRADRGSSDRGAGVTIPSSLLKTP